MRPHFGIFQINYRFSWVRFLVNRNFSRIQFINLGISLYHLKEIFLNFTINFYGKIYLKFKIGAEALSSNEFRFVITKIIGINILKFGIFYHFTI
jgi:hypothetical protein